MKKLAMILAAIMLLSTLSVAVFAADETYCVAGAAALCGEDWNPAGNPMTKNADGLYEKVFDNIPGGSYEFKVTDGSWDNAWGNNGGNYSITLTKESKVTILFNAETKAIEVKIEPKAGAEEVEFTYTVAGQAGLCGAEWDPSKNEMTKNADGLFEITFQNIAAGAYEFKVTVGSWSASWGEGGNNKSISLDAESHVKILFNAETKAIDVVITPVEGAVPVEKNYYVAGVAGLCGEEWAAASEANKMTKNEKGEYEILYKDVKAGTYEFKITDGSWANSWGDNGQNYKFTLNADGPVKITFNAETKAITLEGNSAPTGDNSHVFAFVTLMTLSAVAMGLMLTKKRAF